MRACAAAVLPERHPSIFLVVLVLGDHSSHARHTNGSSGFAASHYLARTLNENQVPLLFRASAMNEQQFMFCSKVFQPIFVNFTREVDEVTIQDIKVELATINRRQFRHLQRNEDLKGKFCGIL